MVQKFVKCNSGEIFFEQVVADVFLVSSKQNFLKNIFHINLIFYHDIQAFFRNLLAHFLIDNFKANLVILAKIRQNSLVDF